MYHTLPLNRGFFIDICYLICQGVLHAPYLDGGKSHNRNGLGVQINCAEYLAEGTVAEIILSDGSVCLVDDCDIHLVPNGSWCNSCGYAVKSVAGRTVRMHTLILKPAQGYVVHHRNGNKLDNRRFNLQILSASTHNKIHKKNVKKEDMLRFAQWRKDRGIKKINQLAWDLFKADHRRTE